MVTSTQPFAENFSFKNPQMQAHVCPCKWLENVWEDARQIAMSATWEGGVGGLNFLLQII